MQSGVCSHCGVKSPNLMAHYDVAHKKQEIAKAEARDAQKKAERNATATNQVMIVYDLIGQLTETYLLQVTDGELSRLKEMHNGFYDQGDHDNLWLKDLLANETPISSTDTIAEKPPVLDLANTTLICTGVHMEDFDNSEDDEDFFASYKDDSDDSDTVTFEMPTDPKAYYFHVVADEESDDATKNSLVVIVPKDYFDKENDFCDDFVADFIDLSDKFEELSSCEFAYSGSVLEAETDLLAKGLVSNSKLAEV